MDPQVAIQSILTLAKISGTVLAIHMAIIIFALRDKLLAQVIAEYTFRIAILPALSLCAKITIDIIMVITIGYLDPLQDYYLISAVIATIVLFLVSISVLFTSVELLIDIKRKSLQRVY